ncbi:hypothetical protein FDUTEX481_00759 [Tolypothrix sp. PCC 7601]|nr:hypothetical protein FDUTEX481_00759 [Tolypothrix sp. PCC 7601]
MIAAVALKRRSQIYCYVIFNRIFHTTPPNDPYSLFFVICCISSAMREIVIYVIQRWRIYHLFR